MQHLLNNFTLIFFIILLTSCSSDGKGDIDPIIGNWEYSTQFENDNQITANDCSPATVEFTESMNRTDLYYGEDETDNCVVVDVVNMTWEKLNSGTYQFTQNGYSFSNIVTFGNNNNTLTIESSDSDGSGNIVIYKFVYTRIN